MLPVVAYGGPSGIHRLPSAASCASMAEGFWSMVIAEMEGRGTRPAKRRCKVRKKATCLFTLSTTSPPVGISRMKAE